MTKPILEGIVSKVRYDKESRKIKINIRNVKLINDEVIEGKSITIYKNNLLDTIKDKIGGVINGRRREEGQ